MISGNMAATVDRKRMHLLLVNREHEERGQVDQDWADWEWADRDCEQTVLLTALPTVLVKKRPFQPSLQQAFRTSLQPSCQPSSTSGS